MGLGTPAQLVELVARGVDIFDCVLPTRIARNGTAFTTKGTISIKGGFNKADLRPIEEGCACYACKNFSRAYIHHLFNANEVLSAILASIHNVHFYLNMMAEIRLSIEEGRFVEYKREFLAAYLTEEKGKVKG